MPTQTGTEGKDTLFGTSEADIIYGLGGDDAFWTAPAPIRSMLRPATTWCC